MGVLWTDFGVLTGLGGRRATVPNRNYTYTMDFAGLIR